MFSELPMKQRTLNGSSISAMTPVSALSLAADCAPRQIVTESTLRREVSRDLDALLNTVALDATVDMDDTPHVRKSILNFGLPDIAIRTIDENGLDEIPGRDPNRDHQL